MIRGIKRFFTPPVFEDEEKTRIANLLSVTLLTLIVIGLARVVLAFNASPLYLSVALRGTATLMATAIAMFALMRAGYVRSACIGFTLYQWGIIACITGYYGGVSLSIYSFFVFVILAAGLLLGGRWAIGYAALSVF